MSNSRIGRRRFVQGAAGTAAGLLILGDVATQFEPSLDFDPIAMKIVNNTEADGLMRCEYREGWTL